MLILTGCFQTNCVVMVSIWLVSRLGMTSTERAAYSIAQLEVRALQLESAE